MEPIEIAELKKIEELAATARRKLPGGGLDYFNLDNPIDRQEVVAWLNIFAKLYLHVATLDTHLFDYRVKVRDRL